jgi:dCMP deaminase
VQPDHKWDRRFLSLAEFIAKWSLDPSTKTGAVIVDPHRRVVSTGYNGFARGVGDHYERYADRDTKYKCVVHCEVYTYPFSSCSRCAAVVIQSGIKRCVAPPLPPELAERWADDLEWAALQFREAGVELDLITL